MVEFHGRIFCTLMIPFPCDERLCWTYRIENSVPPFGLDPTERNKKKQVLQRRRDALPIWPGKVDTPWNCGLLIIFPRARSENARLPRVSAHPSKKACYVLVALF